MGLALNKWLIEPKRAETEPRPSAKRLSQSHRAAADGRIPLRQLRRLGAALVDAGVPHDKFNLGLAASGLTATLFVQLASMAGSPAGGWWADVLRRKMPGGRMLVQAIGLAAGAPFVVLCGWTQSVPAAHSRPDSLGIVQRHLRREYFRVHLRRDPPEARGRRPA